MDARLSDKDKAEKSVKTEEEIIKMAKNEESAVNKDIRK